MPLTSEFVAAATDLWPLSPRDFYPIVDDAPDGVRVMSADQSRASRRILKRGGADYYEYRDTATTRLASFRPEWIRPLAVVDDENVSNQLIQWNDGHFLYQLTYFLGEVNFYYEYEGARYCERMHRGDSCVILPFVPHTFASRNANQLGLILALTFGGQLNGDTRQELSALGLSTARPFFSLQRTSATAAGTAIKFYLNSTGHTVASLSEWSLLDVERLSSIVTGETAPTHAELARIAGALQVSVCDLMPGSHERNRGAELLFSSEAKTWFYPDRDAPAYRFRELASSPSSCTLLEGSSLTSLQVQLLIRRDGLNTVCTSMGTIWDRAPFI